MKATIQVLLGLLIVYLFYVTVQSVNEPITFQKEQQKRYAETIQRLKDIRKAEGAFKEMNGDYTASFDTLIDFVKNGQIAVVRKIGEIPEELLGQITEKEAIAKGMIIRDTTKIAVIDTLFPKNYQIDSLRYIPYAQGREFTLKKGVIETASKLKVKVFEASAPSKYILTGMDEQQIINLNDGLDYKGLKVGSITEVNNGAGNWE
ncbi:MAG: hypothetical protein IKZ99_04520 [Salinivirgaceae bacterium]|nr:hypothetical protein [Salinivirgaceae bacterium]MBR5957608.1 hypothetical protein [Salinivirgaceae bacterium]